MRIRLFYHHLITLLLCGLFCSLTAIAGEIIVHEGESIHDALRQAREWRRTGDTRCLGGITIRIETGRYYMSEPLFLRPEDSGTAESPTTIVGDGDVTLFGDTRQKHTQVWPKEGMERMTDFRIDDCAIIIPTPPADVLATERLEMVVHQRWAIAILRVKGMKVQGDQTAVSFMEPESRLEFDHPWPQPVIGGEQGNSSFLLRTTEQRDGIEQLVIIDGASHVTFQGITFEHTCWNRPLHKGHVTLQGGFPLIDAYKLKENEGLPWDSGLENQAWVERPMSAVSVRNACHVNFDHCCFQHLGATALDYIDQVSDCTVSSCYFDDIGGTAIMGGSFAESPREVHRPYADLAERCERLFISDNTIHNVSSEDHGAVAVALGYVRDCTVSNNTVYQMNYSGICVGWGWTSHDTGMRNNRITRNHVSDYARLLYDAGGIYTLSNQPGSEISGNIIERPSPSPYATNKRAFCIYLDARTDGFTLRNNRTDESKDKPGRLIKRDEIGDNQPGIHLIFEQ